MFIITFKLFVFLSIYVLCTLGAYSCIHDDFVLKHDDGVLYTVSNQKYSANHEPSLQASSFDMAYPNPNNTEPIRFFLDTRFLDDDPGFSCYFPGDVISISGANYTCTDDDILSPDTEGYIRNVLLPDAYAKLVSVLRVMPVQGPLYLQGGTCGFQGGIQVPTSYTSDGTGAKDTDLVVFVTSRPILTAHVLAFAGQCQEDQVGRPIAGHLNLNPTEVDLSDAAHASQLGIVLHELSHVLGFSFGKFSYINAPPTQTEIAYTTITSAAYANDQTEDIVAINTPKVLNFIRDHFGCDGLEGAALEDGGGAGTKLSHWEKRVFMNEYMTGESTHNPVFSALTMNYFEDSGWYSINFTGLDGLVYGKSMGCDFVEKACNLWPSGMGYVCRTDGDTACTFDMQAKGTCGISEWQDSLPLGNQYFSDSYMGGADSLADYCPFYKGDPTDFCTDVGNDDIPNLIDNGETYCPECRCFPSSLVREFPFGGARRLACYRIECAGSDDMRVKVGKYWYSCVANTTISVEGYGGHIYCPAPAQIHAVCARANYTTWPTVNSFSPTTGSPGTVVTITGSGFSENVSVLIHEECANVTVVSDTEITVTIPAWKTMGNPAHIVAQRVSVVVMDKDGRTGLGPETFSIRMSEDPMFYLYIIVWVIEHWLAFLAVFCAFAAAFFVRAARRRERTRMELPLDPIMDYSEMDDSDAQPQ